MSMASILPSGVIVHEAAGDIVGARLLPEEASCLDRAIEARRREFATARCLARQGLAALGVDPRPILPGPHREPCWPTAIVGSITHCPGYRAAAGGRASVLGGLGIDAEVHADLPEGVLSLVSRVEERECLDSLPRDGTCWERLLFSAKERVYKAWFPVAQCWLDFEAVSIRFMPSDQSFRAEFIDPEVPRRFGLASTLHGRYVVSGDHVLTAVTIRC